jgi:hypothetical protein
MVYTAVTDDSKKRQVVMNTMIVYDNFLLSRCCATLFILLVFIASIQVDRM